MTKQQKDNCYRKGCFKQMKLFKSIFWENFRIFLGVAASGLKNTDLHHHPKCSTSYKNVNLNGLNLVQKRDFLEILRY